MPTKKLNPEITALALALGIERTRAGQYGIARLKLIQRARQAVGIFKQPVPKTSDYKFLSEALGITRYRAQKIGKYECRRLLTLGESERRLVMSGSHIARPPKYAPSIDRLMELASKRRMA